VDLKGCLVGLARSLFGEKAEYRWVECYFPFTHPSWELEVSPLSLILIPNFFPLEKAAVTKPNDL
jgi:hypothetical protein